MNKNTRETIDFSENRLEGNLFTCLPVLFYLRELYICGGVRAKLDHCAIV